MSTDYVILPQVLTYKKVLAGTQPAEVMDRIRDGQTFSAQFQRHGDGSLTLTTAPEDNFSVHKAVRLTVHAVEGEEIYVSIKPFNATVFGEECQVASLVVRIVEATETWHSAMEFHGGGRVGTGPEAGPLLDRLRG